MLMRIIINKIGKFICFVMISTDLVMKQSLSPENAIAIRAREDFLYAALTAGWGKQRKEEREDKR